MVDEKLVESSDERDVIEGLDNEPSESWGDYPLDTVFVRKDTRTVSDIVKRIEKGRFKLDPEFQRDFVWSPIQQSRLIESSLMRIPLPVLYVAEDSDGKIIVVDGLQRLTTFFSYMNDGFPLENIGSNDPDSLIRNKKFSELPIHLQERIEDTQLTLYILDSKAPERARLDIFERVNSGVPLTRQQMRNCLYSGKATRWLKRASEHENFLSSTGESLKSKSMRDREVINRFCAFYNLGYESYKGDMEKYLADVLLKMNSMSESELGSIFNDFTNAMALSFKLFGKHSFRKSLVSTSGDDSKSILNISLFEVFSTVLAKNYRVLSEIGADELKPRFVALLRYEKFIDAVSFSTNSTAKVRTRHSLSELAMIKLVDEKIEVVILYDLLASSVDRYEPTLGDDRLFNIAVNIEKVLSDFSKHADWRVIEKYKFDFNLQVSALLKPLDFSESKVDQVVSKIFRETRSF